MWLIACLIALQNLGSMPLRDFDEATVARVAFELSQKTGIEVLLPTIWGGDYINKPPGLHWLIASAIKINSISSGVGLSNLPKESVIRFFPALLSTFIVPLGGLIHKELRKEKNIESLFTAGVLLTLLPIARHGRMAMLDGTQLSAMALLWLCLLKMGNGSKNILNAYFAGLASSFILMLKAPFFIPAGLAGLVPMFLTGELKKTFKWKLMKWFSLGILPGIAWHFWHYIQRGGDAFWLWSGDGATRVLFDSGQGSDLGWRVPLIEMLEGGWPWLIIWPLGILIALQHLSSRWSKWVLSSQLVLALTIIPLKTQLPWYTHPIWLPFSLICGIALSFLIERIPSGSVFIQRLRNLIPSIWIGLGLIVIGFSIFSIQNQEFYKYIFVSFSLGIGWTAGGVLIKDKLIKIRYLGAIFLLIGNLLGLTFLMNSSFWVWEINENWSVIPIAKLAKTAKSPSIYIEGSFERPSLNWYAERQIKTFQGFNGSQWILTKEPKLLSKEAMVNSFKCQVSNSSGDWTLLFCDLENL